MKRICVYSCNFGKYRGETSKGIDIQFKDNIDYYFYTDDRTLKSSRWKIVYCDLKPGDETMDSCRRTSKYVKFVTPEIIRQYDIIIWCDTKCLERLNTLNPTSIRSLFEKDYTIVNVMHPVRKSPQEELTFTIQYKFENTNNAKKFLEEIQHNTYDTKLPNTSFIIRKNDIATTELFEYIYTLLEAKGLQRDQNVYNHAIYERNYPSKQIHVTRDPIQKPLHKPVRKPGFWIKR